MKRKVNPRHRQRGVAAVEFALVLPLLLMLVLGAIDWGWFFFIDQVVTNCAREAARAGSLLSPPPAKQAADATKAATDAATAFLNTVKFTNFTAQSIDASVVAVSGGNAVKVTVTYPAGSLTGLLSNIMPANVHATALMRWQ